MTLGLLTLALALAVLVLSYALWWMWALRRGSIAMIPTVDEPRLAELEQQLGWKIPEPLRQAYLDGAVFRGELQRTFTLRVRGDSVEYVMAQFPVPNLQNHLALRAALRLPEKAFAFASDDFGNYFVLVFAEKSLRVSYWDHEISGLDPITTNFDDFWQALVHATKETRFGPSA